MCVLALSAWQAANATVVGTSCTCQGVVATILTRVSGMWAFHGFIFDVRPFVCVTAALLGPEISASLLRLALAFASSYG